MKIGLAAKMNLLFFAMLMLFGLALGYGLIRQETRVLNAELVARANVLLDSLRIASEYPLLVKDREAISRSAKGLLAQPDVVYCRVEDAQRNTLVEAGAQQTHRVRLFRAIVTTKRGNALSGEELLLGSSPEVQETIGEVFLSLSLAGLDKKIHDVVALVAAIVAGALMVTFMASSLLFRRIVGRPVALLVKGIERLAGGDLDHQVRVHSTDEIGLLADSFNRMTKDLKNVTVSKDYVDDIIQSMTHLLIVLDSNFAIKTVNHAVVETLGYAEQELLGQPLQKVLDESSKAGLEDMVKRGALHNAERVYRAKNGKIIPVLFSGSVMRDRQNELKGIICLAQDVTDRKRLEKAVMQSEKMSAVGQLAAGVAHEINNPLGVIFGFAQGLIRRLQPGDPLEMPLKSIEQEAVRCKNLVQDLLTFSRATRADREPLELNRAVEAALSLVTARARMAQVEVRKELSADLPRILANLNQLQQLVINLANNAFDAMKDGGTLTVRTALIQEEARSWVSLIVADTGRGIAPDVLPRIFEPFFTTKPVGQGTGLGLSLAYEIVRKHSGTLEVKSQAGGAEFCAKFPARTGRELEERVRELRQDAGPPKAGSV